MLQFVVPFAIPESPFELDHVTEATPVLSWAVPVTTSELADVEKFVVPGDSIVIEGGVLSGPGVGFPGVGFGCCRVIVKLRDT